MGDEGTEKAQESKDCAAYEQAYEMVESLPVARRSLTRQLEKLDEEIEQVEEEERLAAEKAAEEERRAQEKAAEEQRIAAEQEAQRQTEAAAASQQASSGSANSFSGSTAQAPTAVVTPPAQNDKVAKVVYIAPQSGSKYHFSASCRGLNRANSIQEMSLSQAQSQGYEL